MNMELHSTGASFVAAKEENNPRDLVAAVVKKQPQGTRKELFEEFLALLQDAPEAYQRAVDFYFFVNMHDYMTSNRSRPDSLRKADAIAQLAERVEAIKAQIVMLDLTMPNGKAMKDCTGAEMAKFGNRFQKIAERVGKAKTVGSVFSEEQVKEIMK